MATNDCSMNQLDFDLLLPPLKRLLDGFKRTERQWIFFSRPFSSFFLFYFILKRLLLCFPVVQTHFDNLLTSQYNNDQSRSLEEPKQERWISQYNNDQKVRRTSRRNMSPY
ncbi:hypothetical protein Bca4012_012754 [Brassica carinata]